jgi:hypothetical protein
VRVTRVIRTRYLAAVRPGSLREGTVCRLTASQGDRTVRAESTVPVSASLVRLTVTEFRGVPR